MKEQSLHIKRLSCVLFLVIFGLPCLLMVVQSFAFGWQWPEVIPDLFTLRAWEAVFADERILTAAGTSFLIGVTVVILNLILALPAGKALAHYDFRGKAAIEVFFLLPLLIPTLAVAIGIQVMMLKTGLANTPTGVVFVHLIPSLPYSIRIFRAAFESLGLRWEEQARTLGATPLTLFWTVWLPLLVPGIQSASMLVFVISLSQYALTAIIGGGTVTTLSMLYFPYFEGANRAVIAVFSVVFALLPLCFFMLMKLLLYLLLFFTRIFPPKFLRRLSGG